jgi:hypothetical protein
MRNINCRNVQREIEEAAPGDLLSAVVNAHLESCAPCATLSREQTKLQAIISSLGTVEAPGDFDFRLRARLAGERRGVGRPSALRDFSFGFRSAAVAMVLVSIGAAFVLVSVWTRTGNPTGQQPTVASNRIIDPVTKGGGSESSLAPAVEGSRDILPAAVEAGLRPAGHEPQKRRIVRSETASVRAGTAGTLDQSDTQAHVIKASDQFDDSYPTAAFPINASYQSLKVSVDDGRGSSRTISLPTVSFGSQRALSQSESPLLASSRGVW